MWILPSFGRPENVERLVHHMPDTPIRLVLFEDDPLLSRYLDISAPEMWDVRLFPSRRLGPTLNLAFNLNPREPYYGFLADDCRPEPANWWYALGEAAGEWGIAYGDDGIHGKELCTHPCLGGELVRQVGFWCMPGVQHSYFDTFWMALGRATGGLRYAPEVKMHHLHPLRGLAPMDETYSRGQESYDEDQEAYLSFIKSDRFKGIVKDVQDRKRAERALEAGDVVRLQ